MVRESFFLTNNSKRQNQAMGGEKRSRSKGTYKLRNLEDLSQLQYTDYLDSESNRKKYDI